MDIGLKRIDFVTLFPEMFESVLGTSILKRAATPVPSQADPSQIRPPVVSYHCHDIRLHTANKHDKVDKPPYGGGPGMVIQCQPLWDCLQAVQAQQPELPATRILLTPTGRRLDQPLVEHLARQPRLILISGHYEGYDQRVIDRLHDEGGLMEVSIGDYVLSGGELASMVLADAVVRLQPGVLGDAASVEHESFSPALDRGLDYPHYTRPPQWAGRSVPDVLRSGDHAKIEAWRLEQSQQRTAQRDPAPKPPAKPNLRPFEREDAPAIDALLRASFPTDAEARLVRDLRDNHLDVIETVATIDNKIVGHILLSELTTQDNPYAPGLLALAPLAVHPEHQHRGIGGALVEDALKQARKARVSRVFVLGDPGYYARFGFKPAADFGWSNPWDVAEPAFAVVELDQNQRTPDAGPLVYPAPFLDLPTDSA